MTGPTNDELTTAFWALNTELTAARASLAEREKQLARETELARVYRAQRDVAQDELHVAETAARDWERVYRDHRCPEFTCCDPDCDGWSHQPTTLEVTPG